MAMLGKIEDLLGLVHPKNPIRQCLCLLQDFQEGRCPEISNIICSQRADDTTRIAVDGDRIYLLIQCYQARSRQQGRFEAHQVYTDVQFLHQGKEWIDVCDLRLKTALPDYDANGNVFFPLGIEPTSRLLLGAGDVVVLFPTDAHAPCLQVDGNSDSLVHKLVIKVKNAHLAAG